MPIAFLNNIFMPDAEVRISPFDRGFLFADSIYEVMPCYRGKLFRFEEHMDRMAHSLEVVRISNPYTRDQWHVLLMDMIARNAAELGEDIGVYVQVSRGNPGCRQHVAMEKVEPTVFACASPLLHRALEDIHPTQAIVCEDIRWGRCDVKANIILPNVMARQMAQDQGASEALLNRNGKIYEAASSNLFLVKDNVIITAPKSHYLLGGITRDLVVELLQQQGEQLDFRPIDPEELFTADELWLTSTNRQIQPLTCVNGNIINHGQVGPVWQRTIAAFYTYLQEQIQ